MAKAVIHPPLLHPSIPAPLSCVFLYLFRFALPSLYPQWRRWPWLTGWECQG